jgi:cell wall-associated NlpC family hydrolase
VRTPPTRALIATLVVSASALAIGLPLPVHAAPDSRTDLRGARAQAVALAEQVKSLEIRAEIATERYNALDDALQTAVNELVLAERALDAARSGVSITTATSNDRVRALYMSGGSAALMASVLDSGSLQDVFDRVGAVDALVGSDRVNSRESREVLVDAKDARERIGRLTAKRVRLQTLADQARADVTRLLTQRRDRLDAATAEVARLAAAYEREQAERAAAQAQQRLEELDLLRVGDLSGDEGPLATPYAERALLAARSQIGDPYLWGGTGPDAWDCSGLVQWAYRQAGINLSRTSRQQWGDAPKVALKDLRAGDLIFWAYDVTDPTTIHHVAMYSGGGRMIEAPRTGLDAREIPVYLDGYIGAVRPGASAAEVPAAPPRDRPSPTRDDRA